MSDGHGGASRRRWPLTLPLASALAACGEKSESAHGQRRSHAASTSTLDWFPNPDHVAIYEALERRATSATSGST